MLITGCIRPQQGQRWLVLKDEKERLKQYIESIVYFIEESPFYNIVFCENSNYEYFDIEAISNKAKCLGKNFEWISFWGDREMILRKDKGYGEGEIIRYALENSVLLKKTRSFAKVTGRLTIKNINSVLMHAKYGMNYFLRDIYRGHGVDTRFYLCERTYYEKYLLGAYMDVGETVNNKIVALEDVFYKITKENRGYKGLTAYPAFVGISGGNGRDYAKMPEWKLKLFSVMCRCNLFNQLYPVALGCGKIKLLITNHFKRGGE